MDTPHLYKTVATCPVCPSRPTRAAIDLTTLARNARAVRAHTRTRLLGVTKADAYGHGAVACSTTLVEAGAAMLGVASAEEALELRQAGLTLPILVLGRTLPEAMPALVQQSITCTLTCAVDAAALHAAAIALNCQATAHVKLDTGMSRLGIQPEDVSAFWDHLATLPALDIEGMFTHFAAADSPAPDAVAFTRQQLNAFLETSALLSARGARPRLLHCCASSGTHTVPDGFCDMVRPGLSLYGGCAAPGQTAYAVEPVMTLRSAVIALSDFSAGRAVSYGCTYICPTPRRLAVIPCGYADGLPRALSNKGYALVNGHLAPLVGRVCMDMTMIDVTDIPDVATGTPVVFFGNPAQLGPLCPTIDAVSASIDAIPYELTCCISKRVPRVYIR